VEEKKMKTAFRLVAMAAWLAVLAMTTWAQDKAGVTTAAASKFAALPGLPACATLSVQRGDPTKGAAVILAKATGGCVIPWHWHTATESLMFVSGKAKIEMKGAAAASAGPGDYVYLPGKHQHQFTCGAGCTFFIVIDGAFDIHYVDKDGNEIPIDKAIPPAKKPAAAGKPAAAKK
jgi:quercetin dioxygenase-like cupin family protein